MKLNWSTFKSFVVTRSIPITWCENDEKYTLNATDGGLLFSCEIQKNPSDTTDLDDFVNNFKDVGNKPIGHRPFADAHGFRARFKGVAFTVTAGQVSNLDYTLSEERWIDGVELIQDNAIFGDSVKFQVVHPTYGILDEFGSDWIIDASIGKQNPVILSYPAKIPAGLTIRIIYNSIGNTDVWLGVNLRLHKKT